MDRNLSKLRETVKDRGARQAAAHGVTEGWTQLSNWTKTTKHFCLPASTKLLGRRWEWIMKCTAKPHRSTKTSTFNNNITECSSYPLHLTIISTANGLIANAKRQKKVKCIQIKNEEIKLSFFGHMPWFSI